MFRLMSICGADEPPIYLLEFSSILFFIVSAPAGSRSLGRRQTPRAVGIQPQTLYLQRCVGGKLSPGANLGGGIATIRLPFPLPSTYFFVYQTSFNPS